MSLTSVPCKNCRNQIEFQSKLCPHCQTLDPVDRSDPQVRVIGWISVGAVLFGLWIMIKMCGG